MLLPPGKFTGVGQVEYNTDCPHCFKKEKFFWNTDKEVGWCHSCESKIVGVRQFERIFEQQLSEIQRRMDDGDVHAIVPQLEPAYNHDKSRQYLKTRDIDLETSLTRRIYFSPTTDEIYIPVWPMSTGYRAKWMRRKIYGSGGWRAVKGMKKAFYAYGHKQIDPSVRSVIIVEGIFDVLTPRLNGYAIALLGIYMSGTQMCYLIDNFDKFHIWLDPGGPARRKAIEIKEQLESYGKEAVNIETDADPGSHGARHPFVKGMKKLLDEER